MHARPQSSHYVLPTHLVHLVLVVLFVSTVMNTASVFLGMTEIGERNRFSVLMLSSNVVPFTESRESTNVVPQRLPVYTPGVALEIVDSDRYGMHDDNDWASVSSPCCLSQKTRTHYPWVSRSFLPVMVS